MLTGVCLAAHADVPVVGHLRGLVVGGLILLGDLGVLLRQKGHCLGQVSIAHLQREEPQYERPRGTGPGARLTLVM